MEFLFFAWRPVAATLVMLIAAVPAYAADDVRPWSATLGGRVHLDFAAFHNDARGPENRNDTEVRRAWLDVSGRAWVVDYKLEADFSGDHVLARDAYVSRRFGNAGRLTLGQFKQYFSLDDRTGSNYGPLLERSGAASTLAPLYRLGASWQARHDDFTWAASVYRLESMDAWQVQGRAAGGRITWAPTPRYGEVLHLGLSLAHEAHDSPGAGAPALRIRPRPAGHLSDASRITLIDFANGRDTRSNKWALEYAQVHGAWSWQGELIGAHFSDGLQHGDIRSGYGLVSWFVTGEARAYDRNSGRFSRIRHIHHRAGAFELALRYEQMRGIQHRDGLPTQRRGSTQAWTLGGNWYLRDNLRCMLNLIDSRNRDRLAGTTVDHTRALTGRLQYDF